MKKMFLVLFVTLVCSTSLFAQSAADAARNEMKKLQWMVGKWEGDAWYDLGQGKRMTVMQTENVQSQLDGLVFTVEGIGRDKNVVYHHAFAVISYDVNAKKYFIRAFTKEGNFIDPETSIDDKAFVWGFMHPQLGKVRYTTSLTDPNKWFEIGENSRDGGKTWVKFMELNLKRKS